MWLYAFSSIDRILTRVLSFWTCDVCLHIADFIHLHGTFITYLKILINSLLLSSPYELAKLLRAINESKTIPPHPKIAACPYFQCPPTLHASPLMLKELFFPRKVLSPHPRTCGKKRMQYRQSDSVAVLPPCKKTCRLLEGHRETPTLSAWILWPTKKRSSPLRPTTRRHKACSCRHGWVAVSVLGG